VAQGGWGVLARACDGAGDEDQKSGTHHEPSREAKCRLYRRHWKL
jgi:hypothetical protein